MYNSTYKTACPVLITNYNDSIHTHSHDGVLQLSQTPKSKPGLSVIMMMLIPKSLYYYPHNTPKNFGKVPGISRNDNDIFLYIVVCLTWIGRVLAGIYSFSRTR